MTEKRRVDQPQPRVIDRGGRKGREPTDDRPSLYGLGPGELDDFVVGLGEPRYRADQLRGWLYRHLVDSFDEMTDLPLALRERLKSVARLHTLVPVAQTPSSDGMAVKYLFRLEDGELVESVLMHYVDPADDDSELDDDWPMAGGVPPGRHTVCLSTQAGCAMGCVFCATGQMGLVRDLTPGECVEQVVICARAVAQSGQRLGNVVFMGMGEPLANWSATWQTVECLHDPLGFGLGARRITISTVGIVPGILRLAEAPIPVRLAVSLHAPDNELRAELVAINTVYGLDDILEACRAYQRAGGRRITFEYVLIDQVNDAPELASRLAARLEGLSSHVNLIPLNPTAGSPMLPSPYSRAVDFESVLRRAGVPTTLRMRRGIDISAGCGQLRSRAAEGRMGRTVAARDEIELVAR